MTYSVVWSLFALQTATALESVVGDSQRIRAAQDRIDWALRRTPRDLGESREPTFRLWYEDFLGVYYHIDETNLRVEVLYVGLSCR